MDRNLERAARDACLSWIRDRTEGGQRLHLFTWAELLHGFPFEGQQVPVAGQSGIWKPRFLTAALSIRTTYTSPGKPPPYDDALGSDGRFRYKYRGTDPTHAHNRALRAAMEAQLPLVWFWGVAQAPSRYHVVAPIWLVQEEEEDHEFVVAVDEAQRWDDRTETNPLERRYVERLTKQRVHQPVFRAQVITAYGERCAICSLRYASLLDAAHIVPDGRPRGDPVVPNGLALCKIHHAAFDENLLGIRPDTLEVEVRSDVRADRDGPMLLHGLQQMQGVPLRIPRAREAQPDPTRLVIRWQEFRSAG